MNAARVEILRAAARCLKEDAIALHAAHSVGGEWKLLDSAHRKAHADAQKRLTLAAALERFAEGG